MIEIEKITLKSASEILLKKGYPDTIEKILDKNTEGLNINSPISELLSKSGIWITQIERVIGITKYTELCENLIKENLAEGIENFFNLYNKKTRK